jgi:hypothetical protein
VTDSQMLLEPLDRRREVDVGQVHDQVNGLAAALALLPVDELDTRD